MIGIIDYGLGNIRAFANIYKKLNIDHRIVSKISDLNGVERIILPGVGAFDYAMECLNKSGMRESLDDFVLNKKVPIIGICVGMQILADTSEEGKLKGLGWIDGVVKKFDKSKLSKKAPLPHMGWNNIKIVKENPLSGKLHLNPRLYFLHSYYFCCNNPENVLATSSYGEEFACIVNSGNVYGIQCHPEKSHNNGIQLLKNFAEI